jgi:hypothetical protein
MARVLTSDPITKTVTLWHDDGEGGATIETRQDVSDIMEFNRARHNSFDQRAGWKGDMHWVGKIPGFIYAQLAKDGILFDQRALRKWLMDPVNRAWLTRPGKL